MPYDPLQLKTDVDAITASPDWQDEGKRRDFIRQIGVDASGSLDPESHTQLMGELWNKAEPGALSKAGKFVGTAVEEVAKSIPAAGGAASLGILDALGVTDSGSGTRLREGVEGLVDTVGQRIKQLDPNDRQEQRDDLLESLKQDLDTGATPEGFTKWLSGAYDNKEIDDPATKEFVDALVSSVSRAGVAADRMGDIDPERLNAFMQSDRNPARADADIPDQLGARRFLADYAATRDPASWEAFKERVTETDQQYEGRMANWRAAQAQLEAVLKNAPDTLMKELAIKRASEMQGSPIDLASAALPLLRGAKVAAAAQAGSKAASLAKTVGMGALKEGAQEATTEMLQDPRATGADIAEAGALGAVGSGILEGGMAGAGALMRPGEAKTPAVPEEAPATVEGVTPLVQEAQATTDVTSAVERAVVKATTATEASLTEAVDKVVSENADLLPATAAALEVTPAEEIPTPIRPQGDQAEGAEVGNVAQERGSIPPVDNVSVPQTEESASSIATPIETTGENLTQKPQPPTTQTPDEVQNQIQETGGPAPLEGQPAQPQAEVQAQEGAAQRGSEGHEVEVTYEPTTTTPSVSRSPQGNIAPDSLDQVRGTGRNLPTNGAASTNVQTAEQTDSLGTSDQFSPEAAVQQEEQGAPAPVTGLSDTVSIANEPMNVVAEVMGLPRLETPLDGSYPHAQAFEDARQAVAQDPQRGSILVKEINARPRAMKPIEVPILLHEAVTRRRALDTASKNLADASPDQKEAAQQQYAAAVDAYAELQNASAIAGTETGRALNFRKMAALLDYSLANMLTTYEGAVQRRATQAEVQEVSKTSNEINRLNGEVEALQASEGAVAEQQSIFEEAMKEALAEAQTEAKKLVTQSRAARKAGKTMAEFMREKADEARKRIRQRGGNLNVGINPADLFDRAVVMASYIVEGITAIGDLTKKMVADFGEAIRQHIPQIEKEARTIVEAEQQVFSETEEVMAKSAIEQLQESEGESLSPRWVYDAVKEQVKAGKKTLDEVFKAITAEVQKVMPDVTERGLRDMFSGYGKVRFPSPDKAAQLVRELRRLAQLASAIEDARQKIPPMRSGPQRDEATLAVREAQKELHRVMKEMGVERAPGPRALKTALDAAKSRLRNQIEALEKQIDEEKRSVKPKAGVEYDDKAKDLIEERDALQDFLNAIDPPQPPTAQERIQATLKDLDKQIAELERRVKERDVFAPKTETPVTEQIQVKRDQRDALNETLKEIRREIEGDPVLTQEEINEMAERNLTRQIDALEQQIKDRDFVKKEGPKAEDTPEIVRLKLKREALRKERDKLKEEVVGKKRKSEAELADAAVKSLEKSIDSLEQRIREGDVGAKGRTSRTPESAKIKNLRAERDSLRQEVQRLRKQAQDMARDPVAEQIKADRDHLDRQIKMYEERLKKGDFRPRPKKAKEYDKALLDKQVQLTKLKEEWSKKVFEAGLAARTPFKKLLDAGAQTLNTSRAILTSLDLSGVLRQGGFITLGNPIRAAKNIIPMLQAFRSEDVAKQSLQKLKNRDNWSNYQRSKLYIAETDQTKLSAQEEAFMSRWLDKIPEGIKGAYIGSLVRGSQRSYVTFLNNLRADTFDAMLNTLQKGPEPTQQEMDSIANYINVATGRGDLGKGKLNQAAVAMNTVFFAPRLVASRFQILGGYPIFKASGRTKALVLKEYAKFLTGAALFYALAGMAQDDDDKPLELDPRSSDFLKVRFGDTRVDPMAGLIQATVFVSRLVAGETKDSKGTIQPLRQNFRLPNLFREVPRTDKVPFGKTNVWKVMTNFMRSKFSPAFGGAVDLMVGEDVVGQPATPSDVLLKMTIPMSFPEAQETMEAHGVPKGAALTTLMLFGAGVQTYGPRK